MRAIRLLPLYAVLGASIQFSIAQDSGPHLTTIYNNGSWGSLVFGENGALYGFAAGELIELTPPASPGGAWTATTLYNPVSLVPTAGPVSGKNGTLYGTLLQGGSLLYGTVYDVVPPASPGGAWTENTLYTMTGGLDGMNPLAGVVRGKDGVLYGALMWGGGYPAGCPGPPGCGTVFELAPPASQGGAWVLTVLHDFTGGSDGGNPAASLVIGTKGELYGTTTAGGISGLGTVFELTPPASPGGAWTETVLHAFTGGNDGAVPTASLVIGKNGELYSTTAGGSSGYGTVFKLTPPASSGGPWTEAVLYGFAGGSDGGSPNGVVIGKDGVLYGTTGDGGTSTFGTVFALKPSTSPGGAWTETVLYSFTGGSDGGFPNASLAIGKSGALYGTTSWGGAPSNTGTWFELNP